MHRRPSECCKTQMPIAAKHVQSPRDELRRQKVAKSSDTHDFTPTQSVFLCEDRSEAKIEGRQN